MYFQKDLRYPKGGFFYCAVKARERQRSVYDRDPIARHEKLMKQASQKRRATIERKRLRPDIAQKTRLTFVGTASEGD